MSCALPPSARSSSLVAARTEAGLPAMTAAEIDATLWNRGRGARYKALPRPRSRNTVY